MSEDPIQCQIVRIDGQIEQAKLYAHLWMARAISGDIKRDSLYEGSDGDELSDMDKVSHAINIAKNHIHKIGDLTERKIELMKKQYEETEL